MARRRKRSKRSHRSYVLAGKKAARSRKRRRNPGFKPRRSAKKYRITAYKTGRGKSTRLRRSPWHRIKPRRVNRRRNPNFKRMARTYFGKNRMMNAVALLAGLGGSAFLKGFTSDMVGNMNETAGTWYKKLYGALSIIAGAALNMQSRKKEIKAVGTGMVVFGLYDLLTSNVPTLANYLPTIGAPEFGGYMDYGRDTYDDGMGASISDGTVEVVSGNNLTAGVTPEVIGDDIDLSDALEMSV